MAELPYVTIVVSGEDAREFLQNQLTQDMALVEASDAPVLSAWCNPKGRVICLFRVSVTADGFALALPQDLADNVAKRLTMFRFRSKVMFKTRDTDAAELGPGGGEPDWEVQNLEAGIPHIGAAQSEEFTSHMLNLDLLGAVSLDKGCYPGQEIVARTHYRGASKRRMLRFTAKSPVQAGAEVLVDDRKVGEVVNAIGTDLLVVMPVAKADATLKSNGTTLSQVELPYSIPE